MDLYILRAGGKKADTLFPLRERQQPESPGWMTALPPPHPPCSQESYTERLALSTLIQDD